MHTRSKLALAGLAATLLMAFAVNSASANHLSVSSQNFRLVWTALTFFGEGTGSTENTIICPVTLEGSFHSSTLAKVIGALIGHVTRATVVGTSCTGGRATILQETLPWHVTYEGFSGTLPRITAVRLLLRNTASFSKQTVASARRAYTRKTALAPQAKSSSNQEGLQPHSEPTKEYGSHCSGRAESAASSARRKAGSRAAPRSPSKVALQGSPSG